MMALPSRAGTGSRCERLCSEKKRSQCVARGSAGSTIGLALALTTLLIFRGLIPLLAVAILATLISVPDVALLGMHLDRQIMQAAAITVVLFPWIRRFLIDAWVFPWLFDQFAEIK